MQYEAMESLERLADVVNDMHVGKAKAVVVNNQSPTLPGLLELQPLVVDGAGQGNTFWAEPCVPIAGPHSHCYWMPEVGSLVWYEHVGGDSQHYVWCGCVWGEDHTLESSDTKPTKRFLRFQKMEVMIDEDAGTLTLKNGDDASIEISSDTITLKAANIVLSSQGNEVKLSASGLDALSGALKVM